MDPIAQQLTQQPLSCITLAGKLAGQAAANPFGNAVTRVLGYGLDVDYIPNQPDGSVFFPPPGVYSFTYSIEGKDNDGVFNPITTITGVNGASVYVTYSQSDQAYDVADGQLYVAVGVVKITPASASGRGGGIGFVIPNLGTGLNVPDIFLTLTPTFYADYSGIAPDITPEFDYGALSEYRPVACSALFTSSSSPLVTGGMVAAAYLPSNAADTLFFGATTNPLGDLDSWENLSLLPGSYNGPLREGAYVWYSPADNLDTAMYSPNDALEHKYPTLCISGQLTPTGAVTTLPAAIQVGRLEVTTVYEGVSTSQLYDAQMMLGSQSIMDAVNRHLAVQPHAMQNKKHTDFQRQVIRGAKPRLSNGQRNPAHGMPWVAQALGQAIPWAVNNRGGLSEAVGMLGDLASAIF